jgi:hypothetical protein
MAIVVCLTTLVERGRAATIRSLERAGLSNLYLVNRPRNERPRAQPLAASDVEKLRAILPIQASLAMRVQRRVLTARGAPFPVSLYAVQGPIGDVFHLRVRSGRMLGDLDTARKSPYWLVGSDVGKLRGFRRASFRSSTLDSGHEVVGSSRTERRRTRAEIPRSTGTGRSCSRWALNLGGRAQGGYRYPIDVAVAQFAGAAEADRASSLVQEADRDRYGPSGPVRVASPIQTLRQYRQARRTFDRIVWIVCLLTAASAVIGISNLLSASVIARAKEIGLRRAVGARSNDIVLQFQVEGLLLGVLGGGVGLLTGLVVGLVSLDRSGPGASLSLATFSFLAGSCAVLGILTGIRPSIRASRIDLAQALREG